MIDHWTCRAERPIQHADLLSLTHLYQPLVGPKAIALYFTLSNQLCAQAKDQLQLQSIDRLLGLLSFTEEELIKLIAFIKALQPGQTPPRVEDSPAPAVTPSNPHPLERP